MRLRIVFKESEPFKVRFEEGLSNSSTLPVYSGSYIVVPSVEAQTLSTAQKVMKRDVTVEKIPYFEVTNNSGGKTASIGNEV